jgi:mono/diheme cytochrome c family protein
MDASARDAEASAAPAEASVRDVAAEASRDATAAPALLSETGLYRDTANGVLAPGVRAYEPQGVLWADGATKRRWVYLPPDTSIDTSDMDGWVYPVGTRLWKEFSVDGTRLETRLLVKVGEALWTLVAYSWKADQSDAVAAPDGVPNAAGTDHDIPSSTDCQRCHGGLPDSVLGFTAVQLSHAGDGVTLDTLVREGRLTKSPASPLVVPGNDATAAALRYLHANCGQCHNARSLVTQQTGVNFWLTVSTLARVERTAAYRSAVSDVRRGLDGSTILSRMRHRGNGQMPPLATKHVDEDGTAAVEAWLRTLAPSTEAGLRDASRDAQAE